MSAEIIQFTSVCIGFVVTCVAIVLIFRYRKLKEQRDLSKKVQDAKDKILADGIIEGPKGTYKPRRWSKRWLERFSEVQEPRSTVKTKWFNK
ncbi:hypothetical protein BVX97_03600 [bacterium E08(2017)]|nr:hypothetical protein BVX97_03600 [bacterium E08(2017)]